MTDTVKDFLSQMKTRCESKAREMAALELSVWDEKHERELTKHFGFTDASLKERKRQLKTAAK